MLETPCRLGLSCDDNSALHTAVRLGKRRAVAALLSALASERFAASPAAHRAFALCFDEIAQQYPRQLLHCNGHAFERGATVFVYLQGQRVDDTWTLTAMNAVEVTLRDADGTKLKVTLAKPR